ncbi:hypothetical protein SASPL_126524 [Salvia splendens]|uniref:Uncharacterized protein n=1 Tax=Salvia splendens TaxID=180675 RepID=A0A8X8XJ21_SALSN|nr:hypothetical protein SASPL_126524 [Salvia splendens]
MKFLEVMAVFQDSFPPSFCTFTEAVAPLMKPLLEFFSHIGSPFCLKCVSLSGLYLQQGEDRYKDAGFKKMEVMGMKVKLVLRQAMRGRKRKASQEERDST